MPTRTSGVITQDWEPVVLHKKAVRASEARDPKAVNAALRQGGVVQTIKKFDGGQNKKPATSLNTRKVDEETEPLAHEKAAAEVRHILQKARLDKKLTQAQLAQLINEKSQVVQDYEAGKAICNQQVLAKMERVLEVKLRGKLKDLKVNTMTSNSSAKAKTLQTRKPNL
ncbi:hypothetical protein O6H91_21G065700 [Diphasiastrum complanatum]|uniref:Uncharacterized protein n=1 Tax=Diphasiastrum complanatum TaxID=34168 RepID=A0ACC2ALE7_DIPCM|nr:hypothetical protein O6H91_Y328600 [Diphasiastrum complanatum]KAJ7518365.1 hypothetical protein O6H91_21G065700 [Diphasiastrum complanatum]